MKKLIQLAAVAVSLILVVGCSTSGDANHPNNHNFGDATAHPSDTHHSGMSSMKDADERTSRMHPSYHDK